MVRLASCWLLSWIRVFAIAVSLLTTNGFRCPTTSLESRIVADCSRRRLTRLPCDLPAGLSGLDLSGNFLTSLQPLNDVRLMNICHLNLRANFIQAVHGDAFRGLPQLEVLDLSDNDLLSLPHDAFRGLVRLTRLALRHTGLRVLPDTLLTHVPRLVTLDLSGNNLTTVPTATLRHAPQLTSLDLGYNQLITVASHSFVFSNGALGNTSSNLRTLNLQSNQLSSLQPAAFVGLVELQHLDLSANQLVLSQAYPAGVFSPLTALQSLYLHGNDDSTELSYPLNVLTAPSLKTLTIDTFRNSQFGLAFANLTSLATLDLQHSCKLVRLTNQTFDAFRGSSLHTLILSGCSLLSFEACCFCQLPNLRVLRMDSAVLTSFTSALLSLYGLQNQNMSLIDLHHSAIYPPTSLEEKNTRFLNNICVSTLNMNSCGIVRVTSTAFTAGGRLASCLQNVDFSLNSVAEISKSVAWRLIIAFRRLVTVHLQNQKSFRRLPEHGLPLTFKPSGYNLTVLLPISSTVETLNLSAAINEIGILPNVIQLPVALKVVDISYCGLYDCHTTLSGAQSLHTLDLSGNVCPSFSDNMFDGAPGLRRLRLADMALNETYLVSRAARLLTSLGRLEHLDLSDNDLRLLPYDMLHGSPHLHTLLLAGNRFQSVPTGLGLQTNLSLLDLSNNMLTTLLPHDRRLLDSLARNHTLHVRLRRNPLSCTCAGLDFVQWLSRTEVRLDGDIFATGFDDDYDDNGRDYPCVLEDGRMSSTGRVMADWDGHWRCCVGQTAFLAALVGLLLQVLGIVVTYIISRNWTYIRYAWRVLRHLPLPRRLAFRNDVILFHADRDLDPLALKVKDLLRNRYHVRVLLPYLAISPGENFAENILEHADDSWKIVVLVTRNLLQDRWAGFLAQHAQRSISDIMPDRVLLLFFDPPARMATALLRGSHLPAQVSLQSLLQLVPERNVFHVHRDASPRHPVFQRLAEIILQEE